MIIGKTFFKRDTVLHARIPSEIKKAFQALAKAKGKTASEYVLELVLKELYPEERTLNHLAGTTQKIIDNDK